MSKSKKALFSLVGAIAVLVGVAGVGYYHKESTTVKVQERVQKVYSLGEITRIEFKQEELVTLEKITGIWQNADYPYLQYDMDRVNEWVNTLKSMETERVIKNVEDGSVYGLNDESMMLTLYDEVNNSQTLHIGNVNQEEKVIYIKSDQDDVIYIVPDETGDILLEKPNAFVICQKVLNEDAAQKLSINNGDGTAIEMTFDEKWYLKDYYEMPCVVKQEDMEQILELVNELQPTSYVGTYENLSKYGLSEPKLTLAVDDAVKISFGNKEGDEVYMNINEDFDVYLVDKSLYEKLSSFKPFDIIEKQFVHLKAAEIAQITLSNPQGNYTLAFEALGVQETPEVTADDKKVELLAETTGTTEVTVAEEGKNEVAVTEQSAAHALLNEKPLNEEEAQSWVEKINESLCIEAPLQNPKIEQKQERKAEATVVYELKDKSKIEIELVPYDINYYILRYNGEVQFAVNKEKVTRLFTELSHTEKDK